VREGRVLLALPPHCEHREETGRGHHQPRDGDPGPQVEGPGGAKGQGRRGPHRPARPGVHRRRARRVVHRRRREHVPGLLGRPRVPPGGALASEGRGSGEAPGRAVLAHRLLGGAVRTVGRARRAIGLPHRRRRPQGGLLQLRGGGSGERGEDRQGGDGPFRRDLLRERLPRPHAHGHVPHQPADALQGRVRPLRPRGVPRAVPVLLPQSPR
jgi:hypothetical protein